MMDIDNEPKEYDEIDWRAYRDEKLDELRLKEDAHREEIRQIQDAAYAERIKHVAAYDYTAHLTRWQRFVVRARDWLYDR